MLPAALRFLWLGAAGPARCRTGRSDPLPTPRAQAFSSRAGSSPRRLARGEVACSSPSSEMLPAALRFPLAWGRRPCALPGGAAPTRYPPPGQNLPLRARVPHSCQQWPGSVPLRPGDLTVRRRDLQPERGAEVRWRRRVSEDAIWGRVEPLAEETVCRRGAGGAWGRVSEDGDSECEAKSLTMATALPSRSGAAAGALCPTPRPGLPPEAIRRFP
jgi:hypothetical protein